jgi:MATE family multidrug resistance protein
LLGIAAVFQVFDGIQVSAAGALRGLKDTRKPMRIGFISYWLIGFTSACLLGFVLQLGAPGLWWGLVLGLAAAAVQLSRRFHKLTAREIVAPETGAATVPHV